MPFTMIHLHVAMRAAGSKTEKKEEFCNERINGAD